MDEKDRINGTESAEADAPEEESNAARLLRILGDKAIPDAPDTALRRAEDKNKKKKQPDDERKTQDGAVIGDGLAESNAAKRVRVLTPADFGEKDDNPVKMSASEKMANFWYHHKWKLIVGTFFAVVLGICIVQLASKTTPDVCVMYMGPEYINATENESINSAITSLMQDYNGDGEIELQFAQIVFLNEQQIKTREAAAHAKGENFIFDATANASNYEQFSYEVMTGETVIFFLDPAAYENMIDMGMGIFLSLDEIFGETPDSAIDEYGIRLGDTGAYEYFTALKKLPSDTVVCMRDVRTMSFYKGEKKTADTFERHISMMRDFIGFTAPEETK